MALGACGKLSKWILLILNTVFLLVGIAVLSLGLWPRFNNDTKGEVFIQWSGMFLVQDTYYESPFVNGVTVVITVGSVLLVVVAFGDFSTHKENRWGLRLYAGLLALLAGSLGVLGMLAYSRRDEIGTKLLDFHNIIYALYWTVPSQEYGSIIAIIPGCLAMESKAPVVMGIFLGTEAVLLVALTCTVILIRNITKDADSE